MMNADPTSPLWATKDELLILDLLEFLRPVPVSYPLKLLPTWRSALSGWGIFLYFFALRASQV
jgi:hypothetical protein